MGFGDWVCSVSFPYLVLVELSRQSRKWTTRLCGCSLCSRSSWSFKRLLCRLMRWSSRQAALAELHHRHSGSSAAVQHSSGKVYLLQNLKVICGDFAALRRAAFLALLSCKPKYFLLPRWSVLHRYGKGGDQHEAATDNKKEGGHSPLQALLHSGRPHDSPPFRSGAFNH